MTIIDIYSGFLGAGKTTLIKKMLQEAYAGQKLMLIENEFGEIGIDGGFLQDAGINITEMNSGCICCSLVGDFGKALREAIDTYAPDRIIIEPSGVGKLSDVIAAVEKVDGVQLGYTVAVVDAGKVKIYMKNFGEFYNNQVETASTIILSRTDAISQDKLDKAVAMLREHNDHATIVTTPWDQLTGMQLLVAMEGGASIAAELKKLELEHHHHHHDHEEGEEHHCCGHHHHDHEEGEEHHCCGHHHHEHEEGEEHHCCGHHHHDHEEGEEHHCCGHHHHEHEEGEEHHCCGHHHHDHEEHHHDHEEHHHDHEDGHCCCGHHDHDHHSHDHHHHHADEVFTSWGVETAKKFTVEQIQTALTALDSGDYGMVLRAKGIIACTDGGWIHFDYVPGEQNVRMGSADVTGKLCVIGAQLQEEKVAGLFGV